MKKFKSLLSVVLSVIMLCGCMLLPVSAEAPLPESEHYYQNNFYGEWNYAYSNKNAEGLFVTFSEQTMTEEGDEYYDIYFDGDEEISIEDVIEKGYYNKMGDVISIYDGNGNLLNVYQGDKLAGVTVYVPGSSFKITLITDSSITAYGFKVVNVTDEMPENVTLYRYHMPDGSIKADCVCDYDNGDYDGDVDYDDDYDFDDDYDDSYDYYYDFDILYDYKNRIIGDEAIVGWTLPDGGEYFYGRYDFFHRIGIYKKYGVYDFYAITTPVQLTQYDVYGFTNSREYFTFDGDRYYMTKEDHLHLISNICLVGGTIPLALPAAITSAVLVTYPSWEWNGSCIGFANTVCLQKKGVLDVVSTQEGATCVRDLKPTKELISLLNYYNAQSASGFLTKDKAFIPGTAEYARQLKKLVNSALDGNLILFEFVPIGTGLSDLFETYHGYAITGAYELPDGGYVLLYYNENDENYADNGICNEMYIPADFSAIYDQDGYYGDNVMFFWTDTFEGYKSFDINGNGSPFIYRIELLKHIFEVIREWFEYYILTVFK